MPDWLQRAYITSTDTDGWYRYLLIDEAEDWWVYSFPQKGLVRFNRLNPGHWCTYLRSRWDGIAVLEW